MNPIELDTSLLSLLPPWYREVLDYQQICLTEQQQFEALAEEIVGVADNFFFQTMDERAVGMWEQVFRIVPNPQVESLAFRRTRVLNRISTRPPYTLGFLYQKLEELIVDYDYSPSAALHEIENHPEIYGEFGVRVCRQTLYSYVEKRIFARLTNKDLPFKGARQKKKTKHIRRMKSAAKGDSIEKRPEEVNTRQEPGHWEMDLVVSCRGGHKCLMALTERVTRQEIMRLIPDKSAASVVRAMNTLERKYGKMFPEVFKTITVDNGTEFSNCEGMETSIFKAGGQRTKVYYCHPYCSSERGSNEKQNQMIRRKFPKGTNFDRVSPKEVRMVEDWLNRYPRKILGWYSSADLFNQIFGGV